MVMPDKRFYPSRMEQEYLTKGYFNVALAEYVFRLGIDKTKLKPILVEYYNFFRQGRN